nr:DUF418 domain-containing protein [Coralloluteibacterium stylophorae]
MWCVRSGVVVDPAAHRRVLMRMLGWGAPLGAALTALALWIALGAEAGSGGRYLALGVMLFANLPLALAYLAVLALAFARMPRLRAWLAPAGRMALTNYILQSLVASLVFYGYGAGLYGQIGRAGQCGLVLAVFAAQLVISRWWMGRFAYGPLEWLWRAATWLRWPPLRRAAADV